LLRHDRRCAPLERVRDKRMPVVLSPYKRDEQVAALYAPRVDADACDFGVAPRLHYRQTLYQLTQSHRFTLRVCAD
jgi:hypothetical protein